VIRIGAKDHGWEINLSEVARIWRAGCIIRAVFLNRITDAYKQDPELELLISAPYFADAIADSELSLRRVVAAASLAGVAVPAFSASLAYLDAIRAERLPAALVQGQRDFFGAHTYKRIDKEGTFHTEWSEDRSETRVD
jgi:6-phosphogluconate dehydrogenase